jgi:hypothetical protein
MRLSTHLFPILDCILLLPKNIFSKAHQPALCQTLSITIAPENPSRHHWIITNSRGLNLV